VSFSESFFTGAIAVPGIPSLITLNTWKGEIFFIYSSSRRFLGGGFNALESGPFPSPAAPWQDAQFSEKSLSPFFKLGQCWGETEIFEIFMTSPRTVFERLATSSAEAFTAINF